MTEQRIRYGMVGGGQGGFIGAVHRIAARLDDGFELVAGALSSDPERARSSGAELQIAPDRIYTDFAQMAAAEAARQDGIEVVSIVTPNHLHYPAAKAFLEAGIHVICDKPVTANLEDAERLAALVKSSGKLFILTHNYTGYPMVRQMRAMIANGDIGTLRHVQVEYAQDWLAEPVEASGTAKGAEWRTDPARSGVGGAIGDIGTHAYNLAAFVTGQVPQHLLADLTSFVPGRRLDDSANILLRYESGAKGMLWASQIATGNENELSLRVYGDKGGLEWHHRSLNQLVYSPLHEQPRIITRNGPGVLPSSARVSRVPSGHPEGYLEGFATIYREAAAAILAARTGTAPAADVAYPTVGDGVRGLQFIVAAAASSSKGAQWVEIAGAR